MGVTKNGTPYLSLKLMDRTGEVNARVWDNAENYDRLFERNDFIRVSSRSSIYQGGMQLTITDLQKCSEDDVILDDFLPVSSFSRDEMFAELMLITEGVRDKFLRELLRRFFEDQAFVQNFKLAPAAKALHHVCLGGLLEHTLSVTRLARMVADNYENINRDLLITGAVLHDIGKVDELSYRKVFEYTDRGRLLGHISIGVTFVQEKINIIEDFPVNLKMLLEHMILSHHGEYEYGSPKRPKTLEAMALYYLDDLDAKVNGFEQFIAHDNGSDSRWSKFHRLFERYLYKERYTSNEIALEAGDEHADIPSSED